MFVNDNLICLIIQLVGLYFGGAFFSAKAWHCSEISAKTKIFDETQFDAHSPTQKDNLESKL